MTTGRKQAEKDPDETSRLEGEKDKQREKEKPPGQQGQDVQRDGK